MFLRAILLTLVVLHICGCGGGNQRDPRAEGALRLSRLAELSSDYAKAVTQIEENLASTEDLPEEFYAKIHSRGSLLIFSVFHQDNYLPENKNVVGNPTGKDREFHFNKETLELVDFGWSQ